MANMIIYKLTNRLNGKSYIGQTIGTLDHRVRYHMRNKRGHSVIRTAIRKYGRPSFKEEILLYCEPSEANYYEELLVQNTLAPNGYNLVVGGKSKRGYRHNPEDIEKIRLASTGRLHTDETKAKISSAHVGMALSDEIKEKISQSRKGKKAGKDHPMYGKHHSDESKRKISENGKKLVHKSEAIEKISIASKLMWESMTDQQKSERSEKISAKLREAHAKNPKEPWNKGKKKLSSNAEEAYRKISKASCNM